MGKENSEDVLTAVGYGFYGRLDLGILILNDKQKRAIQFFGKEITEGKVYHNSFPLYYNKPHKPSLKKDHLVRGHPYQGDSGGPLILMKDKKSYVAGVCVAGTHKNNPNNLQKIGEEMLEKLSIDKLLSKHFNYKKLPIDRDYNPEYEATVTLEIVRSLEEKTYTQEGLPENIKDLRPFIERTLRGNAPVPKIHPLIQKYARPYFHPGILKDKYVALPGIKDWIESFDDHLKITKEQDRKKDSSVL